MKKIRSYVNSHRALFAGLSALVLMGTVQLTTFITVTEIAAPAVPGAGFAGIYPDSTSHTWKISNNGGGWTDIQTASSLPCTYSGGIINCVPSLAGAFDVNGNQVVTTVGATFTGTNTYTVAGCDMSAATDVELRSCVPSTGFGSLVVAHTDGVAEKMWTTYLDDDANGRLVIENGTTANANFLSQIRTYTNGDRQSLIINAVASAATNSSPALALYPCAGTVNGCTGDITSGVLLQLVTFAATLLNIDGTTNFNLLTWNAPFHVNSSKTNGTCTLSGLTPSTCTATVIAGCKAQATYVTPGCTTPVFVSLSSTTLTITGTNACGASVNYWCP